MIKMLSLLVAALFSMAATAHQAPVAVSTHSVQAVAHGGQHAKKHKMVKRHHAHHQKKKIHRHG